MEIHKEDNTAQFKIVYHGPGLCGKTTNLHQIFKRLNPEQRLSPKIEEFPTKQDKTLTFDFLPLQIGKIGIFTAHFSVYTVPGQVYYEKSRRIILDDVDGVVFVADSQPEIRNENIRMLNELKKTLSEIKPDEIIPTVLQFNKRDLHHIMDTAQMLQDLQENDEPWFEASAIQGLGVMETLQMITHLTAETIKPPPKKT